MTEVRVRKIGDYEWAVKDRRTGELLGVLERTNPDEGWWVGTPEDDWTEYPSRAKAITALLARRDKQEEK